MRCPDCLAPGCSGCGALAKADHAGVVRDAATRPYGCNGRERPSRFTNYIAQAGWEDVVWTDPKDFTEHVSRRPIWRTVVHVMSTTCRYDKGQTDPRCRGCAHIKK